jgi:ABC-type branched-subunit amino acid transport system substrate-binding protein
MTVSVTVTLPATQGATRATRSSGSKTITIGFVTDLTGAASSGFLTSKLGIDAYLDQINAADGVNGYKIKYILADTTSTPTGALTAVQKLVQQNNVFAIVENSSDFYGAEPYALQQGIPVVGSAIDVRLARLLQLAQLCPGRSRVHQVLRGGRAEVRVPQHPGPARQH